MPKVYVPTAEVGRVTCLLMWSAHRAVAVRQTLRDTRLLAHVGCPADVPGLPVDPFSLARQQERRDGGEVGWCT